MTPQDMQGAKTPGIVRFAVWLTFFNTWALLKRRSWIDTACGST